MFVDPLSKNQQQLITYIKIIYKLFMTSSDSFCYTAVWLLKIFTEIIFLKSKVIC